MGLLDLIENKILWFFFYKFFFYILLPNFSFFSYQITKKKYQIFSTIIILGRHPKTKINITGHSFFFYKFFFYKLLPNFSFFFTKLQKKITKFFLPILKILLPKFFYQIFYQIFSPNFLYQILLFLKNVIFFEKNMLHTATGRL